jgi:hypothetical protein
MPTIAVCVWSTGYFRDAFEVADQIFNYFVVENRASGSLLSASFAFFIFAQDAHSSSLRFSLYNTIFFQETW